MREYAVVLLTAALVTFLTTPVVRVLAVRLKVVAAVRDARTAVDQLAAETMGPLAGGLGGGGGLGLPGL